MSVNANIRQVVVLAGGRGERLRPLTDNLPKPMVPVNGVPFLDYLIESIRLNKIEKILFLLGYKSDQVIQRYGVEVGGMKVEYSVGDVNDQTGKRLQEAYSKLDENFLLIYGDTFWPFEIGPMIESYNRNETKVSMTVFTNTEGTGEYGFENNVCVAWNGLVQLYDPSRSNSNNNGMDIGYFIVDKTVIPENDNSNFSFQEDLLPLLIQKKDVNSFLTDEQYYYITSVGNLSKFQKIVLEKEFQPVSFVNQ
ncbi:MAG: hypothetical protein CMJ75_02865 [Planctomycetaceae bacterium]|nr:hypothetical protein [Planctomycetaceae bacterium]